MPEDLRVHAGGVGRRVRQLVGERGARAPDQAERAAAQAEAVLAPRRRRLQIGAPAQQAADDLALREPGVHDRAHRLAVGHVQAGEVEGALLEPSAQALREHRAVGITLLGRRLDEEEGAADPRRAGAQVLGQVRLVRDPGQAPVHAQAELLLARGRRGELLGQRARRRRGRAREEGLDLRGQRPQARRIDEGGAGRRGLQRGEAAVGEVGKGEVERLERDVAHGRSSVGRRRTEATEGIDQFLFHPDVGGTNSTRAARRRRSVHTRRIRGAGRGGSVDTSRTGGAGRGGSRGTGRARAPRTRPTRTRGHVTVSPGPLHEAASVLTAAAVRVHGSLPPRRRTFRRDGPRDPRPQSARRDRSPGAGTEGAHHRSRGTCEGEVLRARQRRRRGRSLGGAGRAGAGPSGRRDVPRRRAGARSWTSSTRRGGSATCTARVGGSALASDSSEAPFDRGARRDGARGYRP